MNDDLSLMQVDFFIPVTLNVNAMEFPARLKQFGYSVKLEVDIEGTKVLFEPDEERNWRATLSWEDVEANKQLDRELLQALVEAIEKYTK